MDFNTAHDIVHADAGSSEYCGSCNSTMDKDGVMKAAGLIIKRKQSRGGYYGGEKDQKQDKTKTSSEEKDKKTDADFLANGSITVHKRKVFAFSEIKADDGKLPDEIQIMPIGEWDTVPYGKLIITSEDLQQMADNFKKGVRAGVPIDIDHDGKAAAGWINNLSVKSDGLYAAVEWTPLGQKMLGEKQYRFFSPEFNPEYVDPENRQLQLDNVLIAGSLVNRPLFKELKPLVAHEGETGLLTNKKTVSMIFIEPMNPEELLKKKQAGQTLSASEQAFLKNYLFGEKDDDGDDDEEGKKKGEADSAGDKFKKGEKKTASEDNLNGKTTHSITASELQQLKSDAEAGKKAAEALQNKEIADQVTSWMFSENGGHFQPALKDDLVSFIKTLSDEQRKVFSELVDKMPSQQLLFKETGSSEVMTAGQRQDKITLAARELMEKTKTNGKFTLSFSEAVKKVSQDEQLGGEVKAYDYHKNTVTGAN